MRRARLLVLAAAAVLLLPPIRAALESSMTLQMLVQAPLLVCCGALAGARLSDTARERLARWNSHGMAGLFAVALGMALLMVPRLLDLSVADWRVDVAKAAGLLACGAALRLSWRPAGALVQGFFLGNVLPMTAAVGQLYQDSPLRLCNAYLLGDQQRLGQALVWLSVAVGIAWFAKLVIALARSPQTEPSPESA